MLLDLIKDRDLLRMDSIKRWSLNTTIKNESDSEHSFWVSFYTLILCEDLFQDENYTLSLNYQYMCLSYAIVHDLDEIFSGDIDHNVKRNGVNGKQLTELINQFCKDSIQQKFKNKQFLNIFKQAEDPLIKSIVKLADCLSFYKFIKTEHDLGNTTITDVLNHCIDLIISNSELVIQEHSKIYKNFDYENLNKLINGIRILK